MTLSTKEIEQKAELLLELSTIQKKITIDEIKRVIAPYIDQEIEIATLPSELYIPDSLCSIDPLLNCYPESGSKCITNKISDFGLVSNSNTVLGFGIMSYEVLKLIVLQLHNMDL